MKTPWLEVPLQDYEGHMALPEIGQAQLLADELGAAVCRTAARSVAVIGCAGGNGFDRLPSTVERVVGIDINPAFLDAARRRYALRTPGLELYSADIQSCEWICEPVELVYAGLIFEYVGVATALRAVRRLCTPGGRLVVVLQLPSPTMAKVSPSPYESLQALAPSMRLQDPDRLSETAGQAGFALDERRAVVLPSGKRFMVMSFHLCTTAGNPTPVDA